MKVIGAGGLELRRLVRLLSGTDGIEVVGWGESQADDGLVVSLHVDIEQAPGRPALHAVGPVPALRRPDLSPRQEDVLTAYGSSNDLLDVVARGLGMNAETMKTHLRRIRAKYGAAGRPAPTRRDLYVRAVEDGFLPPPA